MQVRLKSAFLYVWTCSHPDFWLPRAAIQVTLGAIDIRLTVIPLQLVLLSGLNKGGKERTFWVKSTLWQTVNYTVWIKAVPYLSGFIGPVKFRLKITQEKYITFYVWICTQNKKHQSVLNVFRLEHLNLIFKVWVKDILKTEQLSNQYFSSINTESMCTPICRMSTYILHLPYGTV